MLDRSRIIRNIIAILVTVVYIFIGVICIDELGNFETGLKFYIKLIYLFLLGTTIFTYTYIKKKLKEKILNPNMMYVYRYGYFAIIVFISKLVMSYIHGIHFGGKIALQMLVTMLNVILIKRIIFNISTSDMLSAIASLLYIFMPQNLLCIELFEAINYRVTFILVSIWILIHIIDEVSQHRLKSKKYLLLTLLFSLSVVINIIFGGTSISWICIVLIAFLASKNIDFTHINLGQKFIDKVNSVKLKRFIYKLERININKILVVLFYSVLITIISQLVVRGLTGDELFYGFDTFKSFDIKFRDIIKEARTYFLSLTILLVILEVVGIVLKRKIDLKTTVIRSTFLVTIATLMINGSNVYTTGVFEVLLILNFILNISNIYYNREEKIKLLKEKN